GKTEVSDNYAVTGSITISNPSAVTQTVTGVADVLNDTTVASVDCGAAFPIDIVAGGQLVCSYTASPTDDLATSNTATVSAVGNADQTGIAGVSFTENLIGDDSGTLTDDRFAAFSEAVSGDANFTLEEDFVCPTNPSAYGTDGSYTAEVVNTASLNGNINLSDDAKITLDCTLPVLTVAKTAAGTYDRTVTWELVKNVNTEGNDVSDYVGVAGDTFPTDWLLYVGKTEVSDNYAVTGSITISNPSAVTQTVTGVADVLNDTTVASVDCGAAFPIDIVAGGQLVCSYTASPTDDLATSNTATVSAVGNADQTGIAGVSFTENLIGDDSVTLDDDRAPSGFPASISASQTFTYNESFTCSSNRGDYTNGVDTDNYPNTATLKGDNNNLSDNASVTVTCEASFVDVLKLTDGAPTPADKTWTFELRKGATTLETLSTPPTLLEFQTALVMGDTYTMCETGIPAGWTLQWGVDANGNGVIDTGETLPFVGGEADLIGSGLLQVYDPDPNYGTADAVNDTRCVNFAAPTTAGDVFPFIVDNRFPGGEPRTPGYWKNWNTCTGGGQQDTAAANGGATEGFFLLDDLIPTTIGNFAITTCEIGVDILDKREIGVPALVGDGDKMASDPAFNMATALLAAKLNLGAGAETCSAVVDAVADADALLVSIDFNGYPDGNSAWDGKGKPPSYFDKKDPLAAEANALATLLDDYNNGLLCSP
ncbi:MAG: hypothetical protein P1T08_18030, partial [Acidimicrobiia bacterium]|nr:hypothetical protein [Acidimicrobiia bacterium]